MRERSLKRPMWLTAILAVLVLATSCEINAADPDYHPTMVEADSVLKSDSEYIIVLGDLQCYTNISDYFSYYRDTMDWIWSQQQHGKNIKCVLQTGDITENNLRSQYDVFREFTAPTAEVLPYIACTGNHDYDWVDGSLIMDRNSTLFSEYLTFNVVDAKVEARFEPGRMENVIVRNIINGRRYDIIALEFGPRKEVVEWVKEHVLSHPERRYIVLTHEHLTSKGELATNGVYSVSQFRNTTVTTPKQLWENLISENDNIVCLLCGHNGFSAHLTTLNKSGRDVEQILFNLQYQANGGDGWVQIWEFPKDKDYATVDVYNTITSQFHPDIHSFQFKYRY